MDIIGLLIGYAWGAYCADKNHPTWVMLTGCAIIGAVYMLITKWIKND